MVKPAELNLQNISCFHHMFKKGHVCKIFKDYRALAVALVLFVKSNSHKQFQSLTKTNTWPLLSSSHDQVSLKKESTCTSYLQSFAVFIQTFRFFFLTRSIGNRCHFPVSTHNLHQALVDPVPTLSWEPSLDARTRILRLPRSRSLKHQPLANTGPCAHCCEDQSNASVDPILTTAPVFPVNKQIFDRSWNPVSSRWTQVNDR